MKIFTLLLLMFSGVVTAADRSPIFKRGYVQIQYVSGSFQRIDGLPTIEAEIAFPDRPTIIRTISVEGCSVGQGRSYFSGGGKEPSNDSWDAQDNTAYDVTAKFICRLGNS